MFSSIEKLQRNFQGEVETKGGATKFFYHLSPVPGIKKLRPSTSKYSEKEGNKSTNRICFADTMHGCVQALFLPGWTRNFVWDKTDHMLHLTKAMVGKKEYEFSVYRVNALDFDLEYISNHESDKDSSVNVFDMHLTGELGYRKTIACEDMGTIRIKMLSKTEHLAKPYPWIFYWLHIGQLNQYPTPLEDFKLSTKPNSSRILQKDIELDLARFRKRVSAAIPYYEKETVRVMNEIVTYYKTGQYNPK
jgi:hypothetical protein